MNIKFINNPTINDLERVVEYVNRNLEHNSFNHIATNVFLTKNHAKLWHQKYLLQEQVYSIALLDDSIVAVSHVDVFHGRRKHGGKLAITVDYNYRKLNIGDLLLKNIINQCKKAGVLLIRAEPTERNLPMINLLKKNGFLLEGKCTDAFLSDDGEYLDLIEYTKIIEDSYEK